MTRFFYCVFRQLKCLCNKKSRTQPRKTDLETSHFFIFNSDISRQSICLKIVYFIFFLIPSDAQGRNHPQFLLIKMG